jgi:hypothetical protein
MFMGSIPDRFSDREFDEKEQELVELLSEYEEPDTQLAEIAGSVESHRDTVKSHLETLEGKGVVRSRQLHGGNEPWMFALAHEESAYGVPGDIDIGRLGSMRKSIRNIVQMVAWMMLPLAILASFILADRVAAVTGAWFQYEANIPLILGVMMIVALSTFGYIDSECKAIIDEPVLYRFERLRSLLSR